MSAMRLLLKAFVTVVALSAAGCLLHPQDADCRGTVCLCGVDAPMIARTARPSRRLTRKYDSWPAGAGAGGAAIHFGSVKSGEDSFTDMFQLCG